jgi:hypothetical protein
MGGALLGLRSREAWKRIWQTFEAFIATSEQHIDFSQRSKSAFAGEICFPH